MRTISEKAKLNKIYTNHCVRVSVVNELDSNGFTNEQICSVTGHKNLISDKAIQKKEKSLMLLQNLSMKKLSLFPVKVLSSQKKMKTSILIFQREGT